MSENRIEGTSEDFNDDAPLIGHDDPIGGWKELGRTKLTVAGDTITVDNLPNKRYYMIIGNIFEASGAIQPHIELNGDTSSNYSERISIAGGNDSTATSQADMRISVSETGNKFTVGYISNFATKEKIYIGHANSVGTAGAGTAPNRSEGVAKWTNTTDSINSINYKNNAAGNFDVGSEVIVLGFDESDTHSTNFWQELASVQASGSDNILSSGTIPAKKYLWVQIYHTGQADNVKLTFNGDKASSNANYTRRFRIDGGTEGTDVSQDSIDNMTSAGGSTPSFGYFFITNNTSEEKLLIGHAVVQNTAGATNIPKRVESASKWDDTSSQITKIDFDSNNGNFSSKSILKVWGHD